MKDKGFKYALLLFVGSYSLSFIFILHSEERVRKGAEKLAKFLNAKQQGRLDGFFTVMASKGPKNKDTRDNKGKKRKVLMFTFCGIRLGLNVMFPFRLQTIKRKGVARKQRKNRKLPTIHYSLDFVF